MPTFTDADTDVPDRRAPDLSSRAQRGERVLPGSLRRRHLAGRSAVQRLERRRQRNRHCGADADADDNSPLRCRATCRLQLGRDTSITVAWDASWLMRGHTMWSSSRPARLTWSGASCDGGGNQVTGTECVASGLDRGTQYSFRVRAVPDSEDTDSAVERVEFRHQRYDYRTRAGHAGGRRPEPSVAFRGRGPGHALKSPGLGIRWTIAPCSP